MTTDPKMAGYIPLNTFRNNDDDQSSRMIRDIPDNPIIPFEGVEFRYYKLSFYQAEFSDVSNWITLINFALESEPGAGMPAATVTRSGWATPVDFLKWYDGLSTAHSARIDGEGVFLIDFATATSIVNLRLNAGTDYQPKHVRIEASDNLIDWLILDKGSEFLPWVTGIDTLDIAIGSRARKLIAGNNVSFSFDATKDTLTINAGEIAESLLPPLVDHAGQVLSVKTDESGVEWVDPPTSGGSTYKGALVHSSGVVLDPVTRFQRYAIPWSFAERNDGFWDIAHPSRLTIPPGVTKVRLTAAVNTVGRSSVIIIKNGNDESYIGMGSDQKGILGNSQSELMTAVTSVLDVVPGDYFEVSIYHTQDAGFYFGIGSNPAYTWFEIEVIESHVVVPIPAGEPTTHWRLSFTGSNGGEFISIREIGFYTATDERIITAPSASSVWHNDNDYAATMGVDSNDATMWGSDVVSNEWFQVIAPTPVAITKIRITPETALPTEEPDGFLVQKSNDGVEWTTEWEELNIPWLTLVPTDFVKPA